MKLGDKPDDGAMLLGSHGLRNSGGAQAVGSGRSFLQSPNASIIGALLRPQAPAAPIGGGGNGGGAGWRGARPIVR